MLDYKVETTSGYQLSVRSIWTKPVTACDYEVVPLFKLVATEMELEDIYKTERHLLYVVCTRAKEYLAPISEEAGSEFFDDFRALRQEID